MNVLKQLRLARTRIAAQQNVNFGTKTDTKLIFSVQNSNEGEKFTDSDHVRIPYRNLFLFRRIINKVFLS